MTDKETMQVLRYCSDPNPDACNYCQYLKEEHCIVKMAGAALDLIERLTAENAALRAQIPQWISVVDRLPKPGERVIATDGVSAGEAYMGVSGELQRLDLPLRWLTLTGRDATHWMPLPEVPEEGEA